MPLRSVVGVMGAGSSAPAQCAPLGVLVAARGHDLLTGGGGGCMQAVAKAFVEARPKEQRGVSIGVLPGVAAGGDWAAQREGEVAAAGGGGLKPKAPKGYPNDYVELAIRTHLPSSGTKGQDPSSRNHINVLSSDAVIALPGGPGTASEVRLALAYGRPVCLFLAEGDDCIADIGRGEELLKEYGDGQLTLATDIDAVGAWLEKTLPSPAGASAVNRCELL